MKRSIPKKILAVCKDPCTMDIKQYDESIMVYPAFIVDPERKEAVRNAKMWGSKWNRRSNSGVNPTIDEIDNSLSNIRIVGTEHRRNSNSVYKVIFSEKNYLVDARLDTILDTMMNVGVKSGGYLCGEFVWGMVNSDFKLIRVGSESYNYYTKLDRVCSLNRISNKNLKANHIYMTKNGTLSVFLGFVSTISMDVSRLTPTVTSVKKKKAMIWYDISKFTDANDIISDIINSDWKKFRVVTSHKAVEEMEFLQSFPDGLIIPIRNNARDYMYKYYSHIMCYGLEGACDYNTSRLRYHCRDIINNSYILNMVPYGQNPLDSIDPMCRKIIDLYGKGIKY
jgi:hypothetical protein